MGFLEAALSKEEYFTYSDYKTWDFDVRYELIDGTAYMMAPPSRKHQLIVGELFRQLANFLLDKPCEVYPAPFGVRLNAAQDDDTVLEPDIVVVCDTSKLDDKGCIGAPDMVVEIISPSTAGRDYVVKYMKYMNAGVKEYWIVDPESKTVQVHLLRDGEYKTSAYGEKDHVSVHVLGGCVIDFTRIFTEVQRAQAR